MFMTLRDPCFRQTRRSPFHHYNQLQRELDDFIVPAMYVLQHMSEPSAKESSSALAEKNNKDIFEVKMDVTQFSPEELTVKMVDNFVVIEGKHEEKQDEHGFISRQFTRRYAIPEDVKPDEITCNLSSDGFLMLSAPRHIEQPKSTERKLTINFTGQPAVTITKADNSNKTSEESTMPARPDVEVQKGANKEEPMAA